MPKNRKASKQLTLDRLPIAQKKEPPKTTAIIQEKRVVITEIGSLTKEDELALKVGFSLLPSKTRFSSCFRIGEGHLQRNRTNREERTHKQKRQAVAFPAHM
jgi:hypothetical protein